MTTSRRTFLKTGVAGVSMAWGSTGVMAEARNNAEVHDSISANLRELVGKIRLGAEFFLNHTATEESVRKHFRLMQSYDFTVARIFIIWDDIEPTPGAWTFERYDWIYDAARDSGIKIAATLCSEDPPGWMKLTPFYHNHMNLNDPNLREHAATYLEKVVNRYRNHPGQGAWLLMNEPHPEYFFDRATMGAFGKWLESKYGTVEELNKYWFQPIEKFSDVQLSPSQWDSYWVDYHSFIDWHEFNDDNLVEILQWVKGQIRQFDSVHPTHINPVGGNRWQESKTVDFVGASIHPAWLFNDFKRQDFGIAFAYFVDLLAGAAGAKPWWVTELQGGPTIFTGHRPMNPTADELSRWLWDAFGAGARGVVFWLWNPRVLGREAGEWQLVSLEGAASNRVAASKSVLEAVGRMPFLAESTPQPPKTAILYNRETLLLIEIDGRPQQRTHEAVWSLMGCYEALRRKHVPASFIDVDDLKSGGAGKYDVLYLPYSYAIDDHAVSALKDFVRNGGTLWADGLLGWKNEYGAIRPSLPGSLSDVFGWETYMADVNPVEEPYSVTGSNEAAGELWKIPLKLHGAEVLVRDGEGQPFATEHAFGKGKAIYYGAAVTLGYFHRGNPKVQEWITSPAVKASSSALVQLLKASDQVGFRPLHHVTGPVAILTNWGLESEIEIRLAGEYTTVANVLTDAPVKVTRRDQNTYAELIVPAGKACVLKANK
ncbi:MAG TPA: beta-galactosidase [Terriglobia bacterium]|nr:beta-galactosidase [Terriglobia bacterium]